MRLQSSNASPVTADIAAGPGGREGQTAHSRPPSAQGSNLSSIALRPKGDTAERMHAFLARQNDDLSRQARAPHPAQKTVLDLVKLTNDRDSAYPAQLIGVVRQGRDGSPEVELRLDRFLGAFQNGALDGFLSEQHHLATDADKESTSDAIELFEKFRGSSLSKDEQLAVLEWIGEQYGAPEKGYVAQHLMPLIAEWETRSAKFGDRDGFAMLLNTAMRAVHEETVLQGRTTYMHVLRNTITHYALKDTSRSYVQIDRMWREINAFPPYKAVSEARFQYTMNWICHTMRSEAHLLVAHPAIASDAPRDAKRMPNDCAIQWAARLRNMASETSDPEVQLACEEEYAAIYGHFLRHDLTFEFMRDYFEQARSAMHEAGCPDMAQLADELLHQLPGPEHDDFARSKAEIIYKTALHDNPYGRAFGTLLCMRMQDHPAPSTLETLSTMSRWFQKYLFPRWHNDEQGHVNLVLEEGDVDLLKALRKEFINSELNWWVRMPGALRDFLDLDGKDPGAVNWSVKALVRYLVEVEKQPQGIDCTAFIHLVYRALVIDMRPGSAPWHGLQQRQYAALGKMRNRVTIQYDYPNAIRAAAQSRYDTQSIDQNQRENMLRLADLLGDSLWSAGRRDTAAGITLAHQPPAFAAHWMTPTPRPVNLSVPNFGQHPFKLNDELEIVPDDPAVPSYFNLTQSNRLRHGEPFATDLSGVTNLVLHALAHASRNGYRFDFRAVLNIVSIYVNLDGGHDPSECYGVARLLDGREKGKLDLGLELGDNSPDADFVFDYHMMDSPINPEMDDYLEMAFEDVLAYHDRYSHYAQPGMSLPLASNAEQ